MNPTDYLHMVRKALQEHPTFNHIETEKLEILPPHNNFVVSDREKWHIKVSRPENKGIASSLLKIEHNFLQKFPELSELNIQGIIKLPEPYNIATIWEYATIESFTEETFGDRAIQFLAAKLQEMNTKRFDSMEIFTFKNDYFRLVEEKVIKRIDYALSTNPNLYNKTDLRDLEEMVKRMTRKNIQIDKETLVLNHGDAHFDNYVKISGKPSLIDLESIAYGPKEWDMAIVHSVLTRELRKPELWKTFEAQYPNNSINYELLYAFEIFKTISSTSWLLLHPDKNLEFTGRMKELETLLTQGHLPEFYETTRYFLKPALI